MLDIGIHKRFTGFALDVTLDAPLHRTIVLFGPSGAGKSMSLGAISGVVTPDSGRISVGERVLFDSGLGVNVPPQQRRVGLVSQQLALFPHLTVEENIGYGLFKESRVQARSRVQEFLHLCNLDGLARRRPAELSGGQQQRVALARALAVGPSLLLLDEPFSALDRPTRIQLRDELESLQRQLQTTMLFVTHDLGEAYSLADYIAVMDAGKILQCDLPDRLLSAPESLRVAQVIGVKNILPGRVLDESHVRVGARTLEAPALSFAVGARVFICIRPERITLVRKDRHPFDLPNVIEGQIVAQASDGANVTLSFCASGPRIQPDRPFDLEIDTPVYVHERLKLNAESNWTISIKPAAMHLIPG